jgi:hypothetical protein
LITRKLKKILIVNLENCDSVEDSGNESRPVLKEEKGCQNDKGLENSSREKRFKNITQLFFI